MDTFKSNYLSKCAELSIDPSNAVLDTLQKHAHPDRKSMIEKLDLSGHSIPLKSCVALAFALTDDIVFTRLSLADAFLGDDDLRGNSIRADGAIALGQMLKVNASIQHLTMEWNCVGIWDSGIRAIADSLSINQTLEHLDLRNNKIGPQGAQVLALCLKHNTNLKTLDLRWNNAGLLGGRAFADLLKWNVTLTELELAGNEVPEDTLRSISSSIQRNKDRFKHELHAKAHAENLTSTLQTLSQSHQNTLTKLSHQLAATDQQALSLSQKLAQASGEISNSQEAYRLVEARLERLQKEKLELEDNVTNERSLQQRQVSELQREMVFEREKRIKAEDALEKATGDLKGHVLELESQMRKIEMENEVLKKDKSYLIDDAHKFKEREMHNAQLWEDKMKRSESVYHNKLLLLQDAKDKEISEQSKKFEERVHILEVQKRRLEEELDAQKDKNNSDKRHWHQSVSETEERVRLEEEHKRKDLQNQLDHLSQQRDQLHAELTAHLTQHSHLLKEHESDMKRLLDHKTQLHEELSQMKAREAHHVSDATQLRSRLDEARNELKTVLAQIQSTQAEFTREKRDHDKLLAQSQQRENLIQRLKDELRKRDDELDSREEEQFLKMKELQLSINTLLSSKSRKTLRSKSPELDL